MLEFAFRAARDAPEQRLTAGPLGPQGVQRNHREILAASLRLLLDERDNRTHALLSLELNRRTELEWLRECVSNGEQGVHSAQAFACIHEMRYF